jgi:hypothetical protein
MIVTTEKCGLVLIIKFKSLQDRLVQQQKILILLNSDIPVNTIIIFPVNPKLQYCHNDYLDYLWIYQTAFPFATQILPNNSTFF